MVVHYERTGRVAALSIDSAPANALSQELVADENRNFAQHLFVQQPGD